MTDQRLSAAILGFAFVAAWIAFSFGHALLCILGAAAFYGVARVVEGSLDLGELQARLHGGVDNTPPAAARPRPRARVH